MKKTTNEGKTSRALMEFFQLKRLIPRKPSSCSRGDASNAFDTIIHRIIIFQSSHVHSSFYLLAMQYLMKRYLPFEMVMVKVTLKIVF